MIIPSNFTYVYYLDGNISQVTEVTFIGVPVTIRTLDDDVSPLSGGVVDEDRTVTRYTYDAARRLIREHVVVNHVRHTPTPPAVRMTIPPSYYQSQSYQALIELESPPYQTMVEREPHINADPPPRPTPPLARVDITRAYEFDNRGNRTAMRVTGTTAYSVLYTFDLNNRMLTSTQTASNSSVETSRYTYDRNGNKLTRTTGSVVERNTYNAFNQLISVTRPGITASYTYSLNSRLNYNYTLP